MDDLEHAVLDHGRAARTGVPEVIFCEGKSTQQVIQIVRRVVEREGRVLATRVPSDMVRDVLREFPDAVHHGLARMIVLDRRPSPEGTAAGPEEAAAGPYVAVVTAGTSDLPVAEEAAVTLEFLGARVERVNDVGVAGLHRLLDRREVLRRARVVIAVAGMEGALPSVIGGLVPCPVVAVPTSVGYGASFGGLAALLAMLNSCAPGVAVVNIDNGFGAAVHAYKITRGNSE
jgi:NCAIR mutase (PurE)-related protein